MTIMKMHIDTNLFKALEKDVFVSTDTELQKRLKYAVIYCGYFKNFDKKIIESKNDNEIVFELSYNGFSRVFSVKENNNAFHLITTDMNGKTIRRRYVRCIGFFEMIMIIFKRYLRANGIEA